MNIITPHGGEGRAVVFPLSTLKLQQKRHDLDSGLRLVEVEHAAIKAVVDSDRARCAVAAAWHADELTCQLAETMDGRAYGYRTSSADFDALTRGGMAFGRCHPDADREVMRLCELPCQPCVDEVRQSLVNTVRWVLRPNNIVKFGFSRDRGLYL